MKKYNIINNTFGWLMFAVAAFVYCSTIEPAASFWDCPEFITTGYKMEIGHPPGAPFFMLLANLFSQFASDPSTVAKMVNTMSALLSAGCILFLFWTITHLVRRLICTDGQVERMSQTIAIIGSGVVGSLAYTFSDTFWFSAVEGEVYAFSSFFTAVVFWLILKWEDNIEKPGADRWLVLIAYMMGLSIGVHLLNLLCIPAIVLIYYYRVKPSAGVGGSLLALLVSFVLVAVILYGVVPGIVKVGGIFELWFVNDLGFSFNTGVIVYLILLVAVVVAAIAATLKAKAMQLPKVLFIASVTLLGIPFFGNGTSSVVIGLLIIAALAVVLFGVKKIANAESLRRVLNTTLLCFLMLMIGYSTYAITVIRSSANPPMDQNSPEDIFTLGEYLSRDQYGSTPLLYGPTFASPLQGEESTDMPGRIVPKQTKIKDIYERKEKVSADEPDQYEVVYEKKDYVYDNNMLFPRIWDSNHADHYIGWLGSTSQRNIVYDMWSGENVAIPSQLDNIKFFLSYQMAFMYARYFGWNFIGRQNDVQSGGEYENGNCITGISFIDNLWYGDQSQLPDVLKENKGRNVYYALPFLLGLLGLLWQVFRGRKGAQQFWVVFFLFFMTGVAIVLYLNQTPQQPRERDYAYAGSFYAFAIWIGMAVAAIIDLFGKKIKAQQSLFAAAVSVVCLGVPVLMGAQNWDDHDRSGRYACRDFGQNYLNTLQEQGYPIIFTNGDNDTFPLWYNQDTEGVRQDARVCNLSYLQTDWYIDQMVRPAYTSPRLPISWNRIDYVTGHHEYVRINNRKAEILAEMEANPAAARAKYGNNPFELRNVLNYMLKYGEIPTDSIVYTIDKDAVRRSGITIPDSAEIPDVMEISLAGRGGIAKPQLMMLEMLANCNWERPMYIAMTVGRDNFLGLDDYFVLEGLAYRLTPFKGIGLDADKMYDNLMNRYKYGNVADPKVYLDETVSHMCYTHRRLFALLASELLRQADRAKAVGDNAKAQQLIAKTKKVLEKADQVFPNSAISYGYDMGGTADMARAWMGVGNRKKADELFTIYADYACQYLNWYINASNKPVQYATYNCSVHMRNLIDAIYGFEDNGNAQMREKYLRIANTLNEQMAQKGVDLSSSY